MDNSSHVARCVYCRSEVSVLETYAHGDHIKCGTCGTRHKVHRAEHTVRLVIADVAPLQEALHANEQRVERLESELQATRRRLSVGANGIVGGILYVIWQIVFERRSLGASVAFEAFGVTVMTAVVLEILNYRFLAKRRAITRLSTEIDQVRSESRHLQQKIREALKG